MPNSLCLLTRWATICIALCVCFLAPSCNGLSSVAGSDGLRPGLNYMQPLKWRMTYYYRVQEIKPNQRLPRHQKHESPIFEGTPCVGKGTYEVWMVGPRQGEDMRNVKMISASPAPTKISKGKDTDAEFVYYDFAPDGYLPKELTAQVSWEFTTLETYAYWQGLPRVEYDKNSELYKTYTKMEAPINSHPTLQKIARKCIPENDPTDYKTTALNCYNWLVQNFHYDLDQDARIIYTGFQGMTDSYRAWENKTGQCDEISNVLCSMLRSAGIPARPAAGLVHAAANNEIGSPGGHAWTEFYLPEVGWVPMDATWGVNPGTIEPLMSGLGSRRKIPNVDYYFGKHDPYRIVMFKDWNYTLQPAPKTKGVAKTEQFMVGYTDRTSGIRDVVSGWEGVPGIASRSCCGSSNGWMRSESAANITFMPEIELLGPPTASEIAEIEKQIKAEGASFLRMPKLPGKYPICTTGKAMGS